MRDPAEYRKPIACSMALLGACYLTFSLVVYRYCGVWIASPALGSAGLLIKKAAYGVALPGLWISATLCQHVSLRASTRLHDRADNASLQPSTSSFDYCEGRLTFKDAAGPIGQLGSEVQ